MAKGNGSTRSSSSSAPKGLRIPSGGGVRWAEVSDYAHSGFTGWTPMNYKEKLEELRQVGLQSVPVVPNGTIPYKERQEIIKQVTEEAIKAKVVNRNIGTLESDARKQANNLRQAWLRADSLSDNELRRSMQSAGYHPQDVRDAREGHKQAKKDLAMAYARAIIRDEVISRISRHS